MRGIRVIKSSDPKDRLKPGSRSRSKHPNKSKPLSKGWNQRRKAKTLAAKKARRLNRRKRN